MIDDRLWLLVGSHNAPIGDNAITDLVEIDVESGRIVNREVIIDGFAWGEVVAYDDHLIVRTTEPHLGDPDPDRFQGAESSDYVLRIDPEAATVVDQLQIPSLQWAGMLTIVGDRLWNHRVRGWVDLSTGEDSFGHVGSHRASDPLGVRIDGDRLWSMWSDGLSLVDTVTGDRLQWWGLPDSSFKFHDGRFWVSSIVGPDWHNAYEFDLERGVIDTPVPADGLPTRSFESGGYRWDLYNALWDSRSSTRPWPEDVWHQVDLESGDTQSEFSLGEYQPFLATEGHLWLIKLAEDGDHELGRIAIGG